MPGRTTPWKSLVASHALANTGYATPNILRQSDGTLWACHDIHGSATSSSETNVYRSTDGGATWTFIKLVTSCFWPTLFEENGVMYMLATSTEYGNLLLHYSSNNWSTYTTITIASGNFHKSKTAVLRKDGYIFFGIERIVTVSPGVWPQDFLASIYYCDTTQLQTIASWKVSNELTYDRSWGSGSWSNEAWLEGNVLELSGSIYLLLRHNNEVTHGGCLVTTTWNSATPSLTLAFNNVSGFVSVPGGSSKFLPVWDSTTSRFFAFVNHDAHGLILNSKLTTAGDTGWPRTIRSELWLASSADLVTWTTHCVFLRDEIESSTLNMCRKTGFQYADLTYDGTTCRVVVRSGYNGAALYHDANNTSYHEVTNISAVIGSTRTSAVFSIGSWSQGVRYNVPAATVASNVSGFPLRVDLNSITSDSWWSAVLIDGGDIRVTNTSGTEIPSYVESFCQQSRTGIVVCKTDVATSGASVVIWAGNSAAKAYAATDTFGRNNVYDTNAKAALWFGPRSVADQTGKTGTLATASTTGIYRGSNNLYMWEGGSPGQQLPADTDIVLNMSSSNTWEALAYPTDISGGTTFGANNPRYIMLKGAAINTANFALRFLGGFIEFVYRNAANTGYIECRTTAAVISANTLYHVAVQTNGTSITIYLNGTSVASSVITGTYPNAGWQPAEQLWVGGQDSGSPNPRAFSGGVNGIRVHNTARSADWITISSAQDLNMNAVSVYAGAFSFTSGSGGLMLLGVGT